MPITDARKRANKNYNAKAYDTFGVCIRKDSKLLQRFDDYCKSVNKSRRAAVIEAMEEYLANHDTST